MYPPYATQNLITVSGFRAYTPVAATNFTDTTISGYISQATRWITNYCQVDGFFQTTVSGEQSKAVISAEGDMYMFPRIRPVYKGSLNAVRLVKGGFSSSLTLSGNNQYFYQVPYPYTSYVYASSYLAGTGSLSMGGTTQLVSMRGGKVFAELDYTGGYAVIPDDLQMACMLMTSDYINRFNNPLGAESIHQGNFSFSLGTKDESNFVAEAREILDQGGYRRTAQG